MAETMDWSGCLWKVRCLKVIMILVCRCGNKTCGEVRNVQQEYNTEQVEQVHRLSCSLSSQSQDPCFNMVNKQYRFYISFENAICKDYITEKTYNALRLNTIPIVLGGVNYTAELPRRSFINAALFASPQGTLTIIRESLLKCLALADYLYTLLKNETAYQEYFAWRKDYLVHRWQQRSTHISHFQLQFHLCA